MPPQVVSLLNYTHALQGFRSHKVSGQQYHVTSRLNTAAMCSRVARTCLSWVMTKVNMTTNCSPYCSFAWTPAEEEGENKNC